MQLRRYRLAVPALGMFLVLGSQGFGQSPGEHRNEPNSGSATAREEQALELPQVPESARNAAQKALGTTPKEAKMLFGTNPQEYELTATDKSGRAESVRVLEDGKVVKKGKGS